ncbi:MAG: hypothetical protein JJT94_08935 [Bernardetiaceae bacterium]|nr:hypothetical protein [Bernardetiaceae bacterium]
MDWQIVFMILGFLFAAYSVVGNDVIQTLGTFISSNREKKWYILWAYTGSILSIVLLYGWFMHNDPSYGRLTEVPVPAVFHWWYILPPLVLLIITRLGLPVSTTFMVLSIFSVVSVPDDLLSVFSTDKLIGKMIIKSGSGYIVAFLTAIIIYLLISRLTEARFMRTETEGRSDRSKMWTVAQWVATGFLWSQWLIQDLANIFVYLPRQLSFSEVLMALAVLLALQAYIFKIGGGKIQKVIKTKTNTQDIRSATIIDLVYGMVVLFFKEFSNVPMSTTWVFIGLLAGREVAISLALRRSDVYKDFFKRNRTPDQHHALIPPSLAYIFKVLLLDLIKITIGMFVSVGIVFIIWQLM